MRGKVEYELTEYESCQNGMLHSYEVLKFFVNKFRVKNVSQVVIVSCVSVIMSEMIIWKESWMKRIIGRIMW